MPEATSIAILAFVGLVWAAITIVVARYWPGKGAYLCSDCRFNDETSCHKQNRPLAIDCYSYRSLKE